MLPFTIHSDTITSWSPDIVTPSSGCTFGWWRVFHAATSLQNLYKTWSVVDGYTNRKHHRRLTFLIRSGSFFEYILKTLAATSRP